MQKMGGMMETNALGNIELKEDFALFTVNPRIYPLDIVYSAAYIMIDKAFIVLDGDPEKEIKIEIRKKRKEQELKTLVQEFNEELLNYAVYKVQSERNKGLREAILQRVLLTNNPEYLTKNKVMRECHEIEDAEGNNATVARYQQKKR
jgi:His-Xaa-Ser system protein HxsD